MTVVLESPPVRGRGLKPEAVLDDADYDIVAPCAGAWVETTKALAIVTDQRRVAPCAGAWVETCECFGRPRNTWKVAPCAGAWVETIRRRSRSSSWRGSPPVRGRGLKLFTLRGDAERGVVAPCAGAWVETVSDQHGDRRPGRRPLCGGVG